MVHITGGAYTKLKSLLFQANAVLNRGHKLKPQQIFVDLSSKGISDEDMYRTFNCGVGIIISVADKETEGVLKAVKDFRADIIGKIIPGDGKVIIESAFGNRELIL